MRVPYKWESIAGCRLHKFVFHSITQEAVDSLKELVDHGTEGRVFSKYSSVYKYNRLTGGAFGKKKGVYRTAVFLIEDDADALMFNLKFDPKHYWGKKDWSRSSTPMGAGARPF
jgi:hypothetical protein